MILKWGIVYVLQHLFFNIILWWLPRSIVLEINKYTLDAIRTTKAMGALYIGHYNFNHHDGWRGWQRFSCVYVLTVSSCFLIDFFNFSNKQSWFHYLLSIFFVYTRPSGRTKLSKCSPLFPFTQPKINKRFVIETLSNYQLVFWLPEIKSI